MSEIVINSSIPEWCYSGTDRAKLLRLGNEWNLYVDVQCIRYWEVLRLSIIILYYRSFMLFMFPLTLQTAEIFQIITENAAGTSGNSEKIRQPERSGFHDGYAGRNTETV